MIALPQRASAALIVLLTSSGLVAACASAPPDPARYRLMNSGPHWDVSGKDRVLEDLVPRYPEFFEVILDPEQPRLPNMLGLRDDLESKPVERRNFDALNALAIAYFEINYRAESQRGDGLVYLAESQRAAKLLAVPWRGYAETDSNALRSAILDFFEDAASGSKMGASTTSGRLGAVVESLARKEANPERLARIHSIVAELAAQTPARSDD